MARGFKSGGRGKGTPNRLTLTVQAKLEAAGCDPILGMARIADDLTVDIAVRARMYAELAAYVFPKRKSLELPQLAVDAWGPPPNLVVTFLQPNGPPDP